VLNREVLLSLSYDHLALNQRLWSSGRRSLDPVTVELELGRPTEHRAALRLAAGAGLYFHRDSFIEYLPYYTQQHNSLGSTFGMHFGGGFSIPLWKRTLMDLDYRYHQTVGRENALVISTISAGLRFLFPGREPDPEGYVRAGGREAAAYASR